MWFFVLFVLPLLLLEREEARRPEPSLEAVSHQELGQALLLIFGLCVGAALALNVGAYALTWLTGDDYVSQLQTWLAAQAASTAIRAY